MPTKTASPTYLPYRENGAVKYAAPSTSSFSSDSRLYNTHISYDSDNEPLISNSIIPSELNEYDLAHFTATGRPAPRYVPPSGLASLGGHMFTAPQLLPQRYTDDSIIPAIIVDVIPSPSLHPPKARRASLLSKLKPSLKGYDNNEQRRHSEGNGGKEQKGIMKVVFMPRREYLKYFARGLQGEYIGSEPYRRWSEEELERDYEQYRPESMKKKQKN
ncbi:uncharacterized protein PAC_04066 [Phialocephala subalpina]|uniref:Uncharacterized protein n=1 Tax=Phialocephala subalpina TaxID=576137 RepID=A0A1L7WN47_9HELO|nr:uncharacterized protein PAC_04066 [Phialocephala subalpina]